jgi:pimeloyl-ACP methyl ester carboxylesterase
MAKALAPSWLPIDWLVTQRFDTIDKIARVPAPVLLVHGTGDRLVPHRFSEALYAAARDPKKLVLVEGGGHYNTSWVGAPQYREAIAEMFGVPARDSAALLAPAAGKPAPRSRVAAAAVPALLPAAAAR